MHAVFARNALTDHRSYVGPPEYYDLIGGLQFVALMGIGMREHHTVLDVGCGSLRAGRFIVQYLRPGNYYGIEPNEWLIEAAIEHEVGQDMIDLKQPSFSTDAGLNLSAWGVRFDYIVAQSIITHAPLDMVEKLMWEVSGSLAPGGKFIATALIGQEDNQLTDWSYPGGVEWTFQTIEGLVSAAGLTLSQLRLPHPAGQTWMVMT